MIEVRMLRPAVVDGVMRQPGQRLRVSPDTAFELLQWGSAELLRTERTEIRRHRRNSPNLNR
jgi:hypothetical protein